MTENGEIRGPDPREILVALPSALLVVDPAGMIVSVNAGCEMLLNASAAHLVGRPLTSVIMLPRGYDQTSEAAFWAYDVVISHPHKPCLRADFVGTPFAQWRGWHLISLHSGIAAHKMGRRVGGGRTAVGIAAMLAHEIKNPLSGIRGAAQLLGAGANENDGRMTSLIRTEVDRITALIDQMEGFTDTRPLSLAPENIHAIIDHARRVAVAGFGHGLIIRDDFDPSLPPVLIHSNSVVQIILNLLKNAAETAVPGQPRLVTLSTAYRHGVSVEIEGRGEKLTLPIELCVIDDGPGVTPDIIENLFDPFVSTKTSGRGLGLALVDKLIRDMGGIIQYSREGNPPQTVFRILLPRAEIPVS